MPSKAKTPAPVCPICGRTIGVVDGPVAPFFRAHSRPADPRDLRLHGHAIARLCPGSYKAALRPQPKVTTWPGSC